MTELILWLLLPPTNYRPTIGVSMSYAQFQRAEPVEEEAKPAAKCCKECLGKGYVVHGDGYNTECKCPDTCACKKGFKK